MDEFKRESFKHMDIKGAKCPCCNAWYGEKAHGRRVTRRRLKNNDRVEFKKFIG